MNPTRRHFLAQASALATIATAPAALRAQSGTRPLLRAGDQKGGLRALLEAAGELNGLAYDIAWTEFPAAAPLAEALNAAASDQGPGPSAASQPPPERALSDHGPLFEERPGSSVEVTNPQPESRPEPVPATAMPTTGWNLANPAAPGATGRTSGRVETQSSPDHGEQDGRMKQGSGSTVPRFAPPLGTPGTVDPTRGVQPLSGAESMTLRELKSGVAPEGSPSPDDPGIEL